MSLPLQAQHRQHIATVLQVADGAVGGVAHDDLIRRSWLRCMREHRLDPTRMQDAVILPGARLREHQQQLEDFLQIARHGMEALYRQVAGMGYIVLLTDARGVAVDFIGDLQTEPGLRRAGLYLGADWSEAQAGTCGVGTCISTGQALTVHQGDHFDATHIPLTCTTAPVFDPEGRLTAVLDISALRSPEGKQSQHLALQIVKMYAHHIENAAFLQRFRSDWVLRLGAAPQFLEVNPDYLIAIDPGGRVIGFSHPAQLLLQGRSGGGAVLGRPLTHFFELEADALGRFVSPTAGGLVRLAGDGARLHLRVQPPMVVPAARVVGSPRTVSATPIPTPLARLSGGDPALDRQIERAARLVDAPVALLLTGETGVGKEYFARAVHAAGSRRRQPFVAVNCAAIPETLIESELFGHLPGSFSGAGRTAKQGLVQAAHGGTLFLDEIGDMPLALQARLLRVLAEREVLPVGATRPLRVDVRVISATHADLQEKVRAGRFREDLYYRIAGAHLALPALRERHDVDWVIDHLLRDASQAVGSGDPGDTRGPVIDGLALTAEARAALHTHAWPGNLRELANALAFACGMQAGHGGPIALDDLPDHLMQAVVRGARSSLSAPPVFPVHLDATAGIPFAADDGTSAPAASHIVASDGIPVAAQALLVALRTAGWNVSAAARDLGVSRMTLYRRMRRWGIVAPHLRESVPGGTGVTRPVP